MPRDVSLSDSKCWNGGQKWVNEKMKTLFFAGLRAADAGQHGSTDALDGPDHRRRVLHRPGARCRPVCRLRCACRCVIC